MLPSLPYEITLLNRSTSTEPTSTVPTRIVASPPFLSHWFDLPSAIEWYKTFIRFGGCPSSRITTHLIDFSGALFTFHTSAYCPHLREGELKEKQAEQHFLVFILLSCVKALCYRPSSLDEFTQSETFLSFTAFVEVLIDPILKHIGRSHSRSNLRLSIPGKISANKNLYFVAGGWVLSVSYVPQASLLPLLSVCYSCMNTLSLLKWASADH